MTGRRWRWSAVLVAVSCAAVALPPGGLTDTAIGDALPFNVTVSPSAALTDGQPVNITIRQTSPDVLIYEVVSRVCRPGVSYQPATTAQPATDFFLGGDNCPSNPISSSAMVTVADPFAQAFASSSAGSTSRFVVGIGTAQWVTSAVQDRSLTCDSTAGCVLVTEVRFGPSSGGVVQWQPIVTPLTFQPDDPVAGCGGPANGILISGGADRMTDSWIGWTLAECKREGRGVTGALSRAVFTGEGESVKSFAAGGLDLVYTAAGYNADVGLLPAGNAPRPAIAIPVSVNATVLGVSGGRRISGGKIPYKDIRLTLEETSALMSGGITGISDFYQQIFVRNSELDDTGFFDTSSGLAIGATAQADAGSWFMTHHLATIAPDFWKVPDKPLFADDAGRTRGADASLALADPTYALSLTLLSGRPPLRKAVSVQLLNVFSTGGMWFFTDRETATAMGMTAVEIANANGDFVTVDDASVYAGVASMHEGSNGMLLPAPDATAPVDGVTPYPLGYVEYALVPAEPLVDSSCNLRTSSQANLDAWLKYITGDGQAQLPPGMLPLPPALKQQAAERVAQVGQSALTSCTPPVATTTTTLPMDQGPVTVSPNGLPARSGANVASGTAASPGAPPSPTLPASSTASSATELVAVPAFAGRRTVGWTGTLVAFVGITALCGLAALAGAGPGRRARRRGPPDRA